MDSCFRRNDKATHTGSFPCKRSRIEKLQISLDRFYAVLTMKKIFVPLLRRRTGWKLTSGQEKNVFNLPLASEAASSLDLSGPG
jgi:hypothetical protein